MRPRPAALAAALLVTLALAGCAGDQPAGLRGLDWADLGPHYMNCNNMGVTPIAVDYYDLDQDNFDEAFVTMRCGKAAGPRTDQLDVFHGNSSRAEPVVMATFVHRDDEVRLTGCVFFAEGQAFTQGTKD